MKILIQGGRIINPASGLDTAADMAIANGRILTIGNTPPDFTPDTTLNARGCLVLPGLVDLAARLREPGPHGHMLESEMAAAVSGGISSLVCPPDTEPVLDEPGLVEMLKFRSAQLQQARLFPLGALTRQLQGEALTGMVELAESGCIGFSQADLPIQNTRILQRAMQYAATFGYTVWLRPLEPWLGAGVAASGALATRMGLSGVPVLAETLAIMTIAELMAATGAKVHICRLSSAAGVELVRQTRARGLPMTCDVSINSLHLCETDIGYFDSHARFDPPLRSGADRAALREAVSEGLAAVCSDHSPVDEDGKQLPFAEAVPGATGLELLLPLTLKLAEEMKIPLVTALARVTCDPAAVLGIDAGTLAVGKPADICVFEAHEPWRVLPEALRSQGKNTPFIGYEMAGRVSATLVGGRLVFARQG